MNNDFCGWYFKCQTDAHTVAVIPAMHVSGGVRSGSIQIITDEGYWSATLPGPQVKMRSDRPCATLGDSVFYENGIFLNLHTDTLSATGKLRFDALSPLRYDIMGPFRYVPLMECRHSVFSMRHTVNGRLCINGRTYSFTDGTGYIEGDRGRSFPSQYAWTQCSFEGGSLMLSVAEIPLGGFRFTGVISVIQLGGKEYRLATYLGARVLKNSRGEIVLRQGALTLKATLLDTSAYSLAAPVDGAMARLIRENAACHARYHLSRGGRTLLSAESFRASFEYEYPGSDIP